MNLLKQDIQNFINQNINSDIQKLSLQKNPFPEMDYKINQGLAYSSLLIRFVE